MERKEFLEQMGAGAAAMLLMGCFGACKKKDSVSAPSGIDFTLDIGTDAYKTLQTKGGFVYKDGVIVARTQSGDLVAVSQACPHEGYAVVYRKGSDDFFCSLHSSVFKDDGTFVQGPARSGLKKYTVAISGNLVTVKG